MLNGVSNGYAYVEVAPRRESKTCRKLGAAAGAAATAATIYKIGVHNALGTSSEKGIKGVIENLKQFGRNVRDFVLTENGKSVADSFSAIKKDSKTYKNLVKLFNTKFGRAGFIAASVGLPIMLGAAIGRTLGWFGDKALNK